MKGLLNTILFFACPIIFGQGNVQKILNEYKDSLSNYGIVVLVDNGQDLETGSIGWAYESTPMQTKNRFCIGSVTKLYTATIILKLQERNLLSIDDQIFNYVAKHEFIDSSITIRQLLSHTSGIQDISGAELANAALLHPYADYSDSYIFSLIDTIAFEKGTRYAYSNTNYFLLRRIIEQVLDKPYQSVINELIIEPLNLSNTFPYHSNKIELLAHPIIGNQDLNYLPKIATNQISIGIGNIVSDVKDVNLFLRALFVNKEILNSNSLKLMTDFQTYKATKIGLGVFEENFGDRTLVGHTGRAISYISYAFVDKNTGTSFVLLSNNANDYFIDELIVKICKKEKK